MNDRFKFRVWSKTDECLFDTCCPIDYIALGDEFIVMQSTGCRDKAGDLVFDGDILERNGHRRVVSWDDVNLTFKLTPSCPSIIGHQLNFCKDAEIIGNIYEHSDLIKDFG